MKKLSLGLIAFLQALGLSAYVALIGLFFWKAGRLFGPVNNFLGPTLILLIFVISTVISALIFGYYPFNLWWEQKQTQKALRLVFYTIGWLVFFIFIIGLALFFFR